MDLTQLLGQHPDRLMSDAAAAAHVSAAAINKLLHTHFFATLDTAIVNATMPVECHVHYCALINNQLWTSPWPSEYEPADVEVLVRFPTAPSVSITKGHASLSFEVELLNSSRADAPAIATFTADIVDTAVRSNKLGLALSPWRRNITSAWSKPAVASSTLDKVSDMFLVDLTSRLRTGCLLPVPMPLAAFVATMELRVEMNHGVLSVYPVDDAAIGGDAWNAAGCSSIQAGAGADLICTQGTTLSTLRFRHDVALHPVDAKCCGLDYMMRVKVEQELRRGPGEPNCDNDDMFGTSGDGVVGGTGMQAGISTREGVHCSYHGLGDATCAAAHTSRDRLAMVGQCPDDHVVGGLLGDIGSWVGVECRALINARMDYHRCDYENSRIGGSLWPMQEWATECAPLHLPVAFMASDDGVSLTKCCKIEPTVAGCPTGGSKQACSGHGTCQNVEGLPTCVCHAGHSGTACELTCPLGSNYQSCSGHGVCTESAAGSAVGEGSCECEEGWQGEACGSAKCSASCNHGECTSPEQCSCDAGFTGIYCNEPMQCDAHGPYKCFHYQVDNAFCDINCHLSSCGDGDDCGNLAAPPAEDGSTQGHCPCPEFFQVAMPCHPACRVPACRNFDFYIDNPCLDACSPACIARNGDGHYDAECDTAACNWDGGDVGLEEEVEEEVDETVLGAHLAAGFADMVYDPVSTLVSQCSDGNSVTEANWILLDNIAGARLEHALLPEGFEARAHAAIYYSQDRREAVVAFRSSGLPPWAVSEMATMPTLCLVADDCGLVHSGLQAMADSIAKAVINILIVLDDDVRVLVAGNGVGGSLAQLVAMRVCSTDADLCQRMTRLHAFGATRFCLSDTDCANRVDQVIGDKATSWLASCFSGLYEDTTPQLPAGYASALSTEYTVEVPTAFGDPACDSAYAEAIAALEHKDIELCTLTQSDAGDWTNTTTPTKDVNTTEACEDDCSEGENEARCARLNKTYVAPPCPLGSLHDGCECDVCLDKPEGASWDVNSSVACAWSCDPGSYSPPLQILTNTILQCVACDTSRCGVGSVLTNCGKYDAGSCTQCPRKPAYSHYTEVGSCTYRCNKEYYLDDATETCKLCSKQCELGHVPDECGSGEPGACTACSADQLPEHATWSQLGTCDFTCEAGHWLNGTTCQRCVQDCPVGSSKHGCGGVDGTAPGVCVPCGWDSSVTLMMNAAWTGVCEPRCITGYTFNNVTQTCDACDVGKCGPGYYLHGCDHFSPGTCLPCQPVTHADDALWNFTSNGGQSPTGCAGQCVDGAFHNVTAGACQLCMSCGVGHFTDACADTSGGYCTRCTQHDPNTVFTTPGGWHSDTCAEECKPNWWRSSVEELCQPCIANCGVGQEFEQCGRNHPGVCVDCNATLLRPNSHLNETNRCTVQCDADYAVNTTDGTCVMCQQDCGPGLIKVGCGFGLAGECLGCEHDGERALVANSHWEGVCELRCNPGYTFNNTSGSCSACDEDACGAGYYLHGCNHFSPGTCLPCQPVTHAGDLLWVWNTTERCGGYCMSSSYLSNATNACELCEPCKVGEFRTNCTRNSGGYCTRCTQRDPNTIFTTPGGWHSDTCAEECKPNWWRSSVEELCQPCIANCGVGQEFNLCGRDNPGVCVDCNATQLQPNTHFYETNTCAAQCDADYTVNTTDGTCVMCQQDCGPGLIKVGCGFGLAGECLGCEHDGERALVANSHWEGVCELRCNPGYTFNNTSGSCSACDEDACDAGYYLHGCNHFSPGTCLPCQPVTHADDALWNFTSNGGQSPTGCAGQCVDGAFHNVTAGACQLCMSCSDGYYTDACADTSGGYCTRCTQRDPNTIFTTPGGWHSDTCAEECQPNWWRSSVEELCQPCIANCGVGQEFEQCGRNHPGVCIDCNDTNLPLHAVFVEENSCTWECIDNFYRDGDACLACELCPPGSIRTGCSSSTGAGTCTACDDQTFATFTTPNTCDYVCNPGYYNEGGVCVDCLADPCPTGQFKDHCNDTSPGVCRNCTKPYHSKFTTHGGTTEDGCIFECDEGFGGDSCASCDEFMFCNGAGYCSADPASSAITCACRPFFYGPACEFCDEQAACTGHADSCRAHPVFGFLQCMTGDQAGCQSVWRGTQCESCDPTAACYDRAAYCTGENQCGACDTGWAGDDCNSCAEEYYPKTGGDSCTVHCDAATTCNGHGQCTPAGTCDCDSSWAGDEWCSLSVPIVVEGTECPPGTVVMASYWAARSCSGQCSSCTTMEGYSTQPPVCLYRDRYIGNEWFSSDCDGPTTIGECKATVVERVQCRAQGELAAECPPGTVAVYGYYPELSCELTEAERMQFTNQAGQSEPCRTADVPEWPSCSIDAGFYSTAPTCTLGAIPLGASCQPFFKQCTAQAQNNLCEPAFKVACCV